MVSPDGRMIAYVGFDDDQRSYVRHQALRDEPRRRRQRVVTGQPRSHRRRPRLVGRQLARSTPIRRTRQQHASPASGSTARSTTSRRPDRQRARPPLCGGEFSVSRRPAASPSPSATRQRPSDVGVVDAAATSRRLTHLNELAWAKALGQRRRRSPSLARRPAADRRLDDHPAGLRCRRRNIR